MATVADTGTVMTDRNTSIDLPMTLAEQTDFRETGRIDEVERLAADYARRWPDAVRSFEYGRSAEGRPLRALIVSRTGVLSADELQRRKIPVLLIQAGIHPGESDGKDAGFIAMRELLTDQVSPGALAHIALLFVPAFNTDGHERFGRWNRPNQVGPEKMGWRTTAQNLNLNRDYMKADAPEMQAMLRLIDAWDPLICADMHVTDGADFEPDVSIQVEPVHQGNPALFASGTQLRDELNATLAAAGSMPLPFYPDLFHTDDPSSGFILTVYAPRFSTGYYPARNRFTVLVETHSWKPYPVRVRVTRNTIIGLVDLLLQHGERWLAQARQADAADAKLDGGNVALNFASGWREPTATPGSGVGRAGASSAQVTTDPNVTIIDFRGYAYTRKPSAITGDLVTVYDPKTPQIWRVPFRKNITPSLIVAAPGLGYIVTAGYAQAIAEKLTLHGIAFEPLPAAVSRMSIETFRATQAAFATSPFEGRMRVTLHGEWRKESRDLPAGSLLVPVEQPRARLLMALLEPRAPDSFAAWGFFNGCFEMKEYMEPYVGEMIANDLLHNDAALAAEFTRKLRDEPAFAASPGARLEFFHRRHESWDEQLNLYPVYRLQRRAPPTSSQ